MALKRSSVPLSGSTGGWLPVDHGEWEKSLPTLAAFLFDATYEDGSERQTGTLLLFGQDGLVKCFLNDRDTDSSACLSAKTPGALLMKAEKQLQAGAVEWRGRPPQRKGGGKKGGQP